MLVIRLGAIGDVVNALVLADALQLGSPDVEVGWAVHPLSAPLVRDHPCVKRVHIWERGSAMGTLRSGRRLAAELRETDYGLVVDLSRIAKSALLARASGAPWILGYDRGRAKEGSWLLHTDRISPGHPRTHMLEQVLEFAGHLGLPADQARRRLPHDAAADAWADGLVAELGAPPILVHVGASKPENRWAPECHGELARLLRADYPAVCVTGGPDVRAAGSVTMTTAGPGVRDLVGATSLRQYASLAARSALFVGCDTGPMHLAAAAGCSIVALFGPADPLRTGPYGAHTVIRSPDAGTDRDAPLPPASMEALRPAAVAATCLTKL